MATPLTFPASEAALRALRAGDEVRISGRLLTAREAGHRLLVRPDQAPPRGWTEGALLYHCGPVVARDPATGAWRFVAAGPSRSSRVEALAPEVLARCGVRGLLGKGGMGPETLEALRRHGAVYLHAGPQLAVTLARHVTRVVDVHGLDALGLTEALWLVEVEDFPATVTMDAHGESLHAPLRPEGGEERHEPAAG
ncbi:MAG: fumarate hydratase C-terminal domain-containing protein [Anaeromyxobacter sp.]